MGLPQPFVRLLYPGRGRWFRSRSAAQGALSPAERGFLPHDLDPRQAGDLIALVQGTGFLGEQYRLLSPDFAAVLPDARVAALHLLNFCEQHRSYPLHLDWDGLEALARSRLWHARGRARVVTSLVNAHLALHPDAAESGGFWARVLPILRRVGRPCLIIGDSHSRRYARVGLQRSAPVMPLHILCTGGSAGGLGNPTSRSGYGARLMRVSAGLAAEPSARDLPVLLQFGQVDVEFVSTFQRIARHETEFNEANFHAFCARTVAAYRDFLLRTFADQPALSVLSILPPALSDAAWAAGYCNAHIAALEFAGITGRSDDAREIRRAVEGIAIPDLATRTRLHRAFNSRLRALCDRAGFRFVEIFDVLLGPDGTVDRRFIAVSRGQDHHLDDEPMHSLTRAVVENAVRQATSDAARRPVRRRPLR